LLASALLASLNVTQRPLQFVQSCQRVVVMGTGLAAYQSGPRKLALEQRNTEKFISFRGRKVFKHFAHREQLFVQTVLSASSSSTASSCVAASNPQCACICVRTDDFSFSKQRFHAV
jgi:hypothetical protein